MALAAGFDRNAFVVEGRQVRAAVRAEHAGGFLDEISVVLSEAETAAVATASVLKESIVAKASNSQEASNGNRVTVAAIVP